MAQSNYRITKKALTSSLLHCSILFLIALGVRLYNFRLGQVFISSDEVYFFQYAIKPLSLLFTPSIENIATELFRFSNFSWGWGTLIWSTISSAVMTAFGMPITELTINLPYVFIGVGTVILTYFLGKEIEGKTFGFIAAFFIAIFPSYVGATRSISGNIVGVFFFFLSIILFLIYFKTKKELCKKVAYVAIGFHVITDNQAPGLFFVILYASFLYCAEKKFLPRLYCSIKQIISGKGVLFSFLIVSPTLLATLYLTQKGMITHSYLNLFHSKPIELNFYFFETLQTIYDNIGAALFIFLIIGLFYYLVTLMMRKRSKESTLFLFFFIFYSIPWFFLVVPTSVTLRGYNAYMIIAIIFLTTYFITDALAYIQTRKTAFGKVTLTMIGASVLLFLLLYTGLALSSAVYAQDYLGVHLPIAIVGAVGENNGIKTAGYFVREHLPSNAVIFADQEVFVSEYYFGRQVVGDLDLSASATASLFQQLIEQGDNYNAYKKYLHQPEKKEYSGSITYVFITEQNVPLYREVLHSTGFAPIMYVTKGNAVIATLYQKKQEQNANIVVWEIEEYDSLFDDKYGNVQSLFVDYG